MKFITQLERFERILSLVKRKATGTPEEFANRLGISESTLYEHIKLLKLKGADIDYCACRQSYVLHIDFVIAFGISNLELNKIKGGCSLFSSLRKFRSRCFYTCGAFDLTNK